MTLKLCECADYVKYCPPYAAPFLSSQTRKVLESERLKAKERKRATDREILISLQLRDWKKRICKLKRGRTKEQRMLLLSACALQGVWKYFDPLWYIDLLIFTGEIYSCRKLKTNIRFSSGREHKRPLPNIGFQLFIPTYARYTNLLWCRHKYQHISRPTNKNRGQSDHNNDNMIGNCSWTKSTSLNRIRIWFFKKKSLFLFISAGE